MAAFEATEGHDADAHQRDTALPDHRAGHRADAYNVFFELASSQPGTREFVMYHPRDRQVMTSHKLDPLQLSPAALALDQTRGHYALREARHLHWKYFWFD